MDDVSYCVKVFNGMHTQVNGLCKTKKVQDTITKIANELGSEVKI